MRRITRVGWLSGHQLDSDLARRARIGTWVGAAVGLLVVVIAAAGADRPPPPGFLWVVVLAGVLGVAVRRAIPLLLATWADSGPRRALVSSALVGLGSGALLWAVASLVSGGEPSVTPTPTSRLVGLLAVGLLTSLGGVAVAGASRLVERRLAWRPDESTS